MRKSLPLWMLALLVGPAFGQSPCDPSLPQIADNPHGYRLRGGRCEGIYVKEVGATLLRVVSLTASFDAIDHASGKPLLVQWARPAGGGAVRLRAEGLKRRQYYRMDALPPGDSTSFAWPTEILAAQAIGRQDLGVTALTTMTVGGAPRNVLLPVQIAQTAASPEKRYRLLLLPGAELEEVFVSLGAAGPQGRPLKYLKDGEPLRYGYYPADRAIAVPIGDLPAAGVYFVAISARLRSGASATLELWLHHGG